MSALLRRHYFRVSVRLATPPCPLRDHVAFRLQWPLRDLLRVQSPRGLSTLLLEIEHGCALLLVQALREPLSQARGWHMVWVGLSERLHREFCAECLAGRS